MKRINFKWLVTPAYYIQQKFLFLKKRNYTLAYSEESLNFFKEEGEEFYIRKVHSLIFFMVCKITWMTEKKVS